MALVVEYCVGMMLFQADDRLIASMGRQRGRRAYFRSALQGFRVPRAGRYTLDLFGAKRFRGGLCGF